MSGTLIVVAPASITASTTSGTVQLNVNGSTDTAFGGAITNNVGSTFNFNKQGSGTLTLGGPNTFTGTTSINAGTLLLQNASIAAGGPASLPSEVRLVSGDRLVLDNQDTVVHTLGGWQVISWALVLSLPVMLPLALWTLPEDLGAISTSGWLALAYVSLFSMMIGFIFWYRGLALGGIAGVGQLQLLHCHSAAGAKTL